MPATVILLLGTSSAGKTSLGRELQEVLSEHFLLIGIDDIFRMVSPRWGSQGEFRDEGFRYEHHPDNSTVTIPYGEVGKSVLQGMHRAVASFAQSGTNVIVDDMLLDDWVIHDWAHVLLAYRTYIVKVQAPMPVLEEREFTRRNPKGLSRGHFAVNDIPVYDFLVNTVDLSPKEGAEVLAKWLMQNPPTNAVQYYSPGTSHP